ncbi:mannitol dehydrogenase family protein [Corynebacterium uberis]|uniref:mannitol dehydrogenase family protein n=1 Tax=Corynebacterium TaxID=1716 RepID=UPI001D0B93CF|nr:MULTISPECIES: mannitol dehydrogenase family protein [Corynebacterium]MCZ9310237.1 mannitol dehydrogenase family protein [Corynebacterium sp. c6VSa_13]UDL75407.1 mannitol dehydrogenase family protein [Corynebacterium uberis]UDL77620.1 mannitol dehydrogenase family protein [Corynebacterium uberis]UDL79905.1 mannitol dehydrogenase family protein [Corynebacterium uberis]UDL84244.1 mannitol dehydrogenase family protein [Corynebacterium uberis]
MTSATPTPLNRSTAPCPPAPPVRLVHLGLGAFHRAHQVWYTQNAEDPAGDPQWGYASFTGLGPELAEALAPQDGLYTLVERSGSGDTPQLIWSLVDPRPATDTARLCELLANPDVAVVTLTVTEAGYHLTAAGELDTDDAEVAADIAALRGSTASDAEVDLVTAAGRVLVGLRARKAALEGGVDKQSGIAVMSCDNISANGETTRASVLGMARAVDPELAAWVEDHVTFPSTSIDRITPATTDELIADVAEETGFADAAPVVTEPFASWVICGDFPAGRPDWEKAGAQFVDDIDAFERRKLWLLNGSHSLMAYYGQLRGHDTVDQAISDPQIRQRVEALWDAAAEHLTAPELAVPDYRASLIERFENPRIRHSLVQIGTDGATKQRMRAAAILHAERAAGRSGQAAAFSLAAWITYLLGVNERGEEIRDTRAADLAAACTSDTPVAALVGVLDEELAADTAAVELIAGLVEELRAEAS